MVLIFAITLFISAFLLFLIQPMVGKMVLPLLGGTPAVWNTCMVFFQAVLLLGYSYAHGTTRLLGIKKQVFLHWIVIAIPIALLLLPFGVPDDVSTPETGNPVLWLTISLFLWVGIPFFVVSTSAPLLQKWFAGTGHKSADDPYFLYAASNFGSMLALFGYPLVLERIMNLTDQASLWMYGYYGLAGFVFICSIVLITSGKKSKLAEESVATDATGAVDSDFIDNDTKENERPVNAIRRLKWILWSMIPSSLMLGVTTHITTNIAAVPLIWIVPLALYLFTFIIVFSKKPVIPHRIVVYLFPIIAIPATITSNGDPVWIYDVVFHISAFFLAAMLCHGKLAIDRPSTSHLTEFFFFMSVGGVMGGLFNAFVAPTLFPDLWEYPIMLILAMMMLCPDILKIARDENTDVKKVLAVNVIIAVSLGGLAYLVIPAIENSGSDIFIKRLSFYGVCVFLSVLVLNRPIALVLTLTFLTSIFPIFGQEPNTETIYKSRNFFGVKEIVQGRGINEKTGVQSTDYTNVFVHGTIIHGFQIMTPEMRFEPMTYFHRLGPVGDVFRAVGKASDAENVGVVGLATGSMAAYGEPGQHFTFFEIDPDVVKIAENPEYFTFLSDCKADYTCIVGDGRLQLKKMEDDHFDLLFLDAFSSDAVPTHLLTKEAITLYDQKVKDDGVIVFNVTNTYLNLHGLLGNIASELDMIAMYREDTNFMNFPDEIRDMKYASQYVVMSRNQKALDEIKRKARFGGSSSLGNESGEWQDLAFNDKYPVWTDQYTSIMKIFILPFVDK